MGERADLRFVVIVRGPTDYVDTIAEVRRREPSRERLGRGVPISSDSRLGSRRHPRARISTVQNMGGACRPSGPICQ